jgi:hypothetical protein
MTFYRADKRLPAEIKRTGFVARNPMDSNLAREHLIKYFCEGSSALNPGDLSTWIIDSTKPEYVSSAPTEECNGQAAGKYVYRMDFFGLLNNTPAQQFFPTSPHLKSSKTTLAINHFRRCDQSQEC